jgi:hypothetical protein
MIRMVIARDGLKKKELARKCDISRSEFSEMIWGDRLIPKPVLKQLLHELSIEDKVYKLGLLDRDTKEVDPEQLL